MLQVTSNFQASLAVLASCKLVAFEQGLHHLGWDLFRFVWLS